MSERPCTYLAEAAARRREAARQGTATYEQRMWRVSMGVFVAAGFVLALWIAVVAYILWFDNGGPWNIA